VIGSRPLPSHIQRCSFLHKVDDETGFLFHFDAFRHVVDGGQGRRVTCNLKHLAEIRVDVRPKQGNSSSSSSSSLCITSHDHHRLLLPTFWGALLLRP
jgi:hypothetical protein